MSERDHFPTSLKIWKYKIERIARQMGLDMFPIRYEVVNDREMSELAARHGFPVTEHHWQYGQESLSMKKQFRYGMSVIYEMVINTAISYAYLLQRNEETDQKSVMAHVCGHVDFFKHNAYFQVTNRDMLNERASDARLVDEYCKRVGYERVEQFLDQVLSFEWSINPHAPYTNSSTAHPSMEDRIRELEAKLIPKRIEPKTPMPQYMDEYLNPPEWIKEEKLRLAVEVITEINKDRGTTVPQEPTRDLLQFLHDHAPLEYWQKDLIAMIRRHAYYMVPQARTKVMNEGWASLWQEEILNEANVMQSVSEVVLHCQHLAGVQRKGGGLNPYRLGVDLWRDIKWRWDTNRHGAIWEECPHRSIHEHWDRFIIFKTIYDQAGGDRTTIATQWRQVSAFIKALKAGDLKIPKELFVRDFLTNEELVPAWHRYQKAASEYERYDRMRVTMEPLEKATMALYRHLPQTLPDEELQWKARRQVYEQAGQDQLWFWTLQEVSAELAAIKALLDFQRNWQSTYDNIPDIAIPEEWYEWAEKNNHPVTLGQGTEKIFQVRATHDDQSFLHEFFTQDFCEANKYFVYKTKTVWYDDHKHAVVDTKSFRRIKSRILLRYVNMHLPIIKVKDANYQSGGELYLVHDHQGVDLDFSTKQGRYMEDVLRQLFHLWGGQRRVYLETVLTDKDKEQPWWVDWKGNKTPDTDDTPIRSGTRVVFTYGLKKDELMFPGDDTPGPHKVEEEYDMYSLDEMVLFPAPY